MSREQIAKNLPVIQAYAEGKTIQVADAGLKNWTDFKGDGPDFTGTEWDWRVKPPTASYRVALMAHTVEYSHTITVDCEAAAYLASKQSHFIRWLTDWIEYEV